MAQSSARQAALVALQLWRTEHRRGDSILSELLRETSMGVSDRAFTVELFYGVLRNLTLLDFWIGCLRPSTIDADLHDVLRLGLYQILVLGIPDHAAVHESVELARKKGRGLINAILRTATRQRDELRQRVQVQPLSVRESHPGFLISRWQKSFGAEATTALCRWNNQAPPIYARINQLQIDPEQFTHRYPDAQPSGRGSQFVRFVAIPKAALDRGHCYIQDPSTALACRMVNPQPGEKVLDACAAPGGKTGFLAEMMQNRGLIVACDRDPERVRLLQENVARLKAEIVQTIEHDWEKPIPRKLESLAPFDRILIDAPCTNTGVMRRRVDVRWRLRPEDLPRMQQQQLKIIEAALGLLRPDGILVYSTCSLESEENDRVMERLLAIGTNMRLLERKDLLPFRDKCDGAFAAALQENSGSSH